MKFGAVDYVEPSVVWYFRRYVNGWLVKLDPNSVASFMQEPGPRFVIVPTELLKTHFANLPPGWKTRSIEAFYGVKGKRIALSVVLKP
jgi:hypothetical protein